MRPRRTDANSRELLAALRRMGWVCIPTHELRNFVDIMACRAGQVRLIELKTDRGKLTASQERLIDEGWPIHLVRTVEDCEALR